MDETRQTAGRSSTAIAITCAVLSLFLLLVVTFVDLNLRLTYWHWFVDAPAFRVDAFFLLAVVGVALSFVVFRRSRGLSFAMFSLTAPLALALLRGREYPWRLSETYLPDAVSFSSWGVYFDYHAITADCVQPVFLGTKPPGLMLFETLIQDLIGVRFGASLSDRMFAGAFVDYIVMAACFAAVVWIVWRVLSKEIGEPTASFITTLTLLSPISLQLNMEFDTCAFPLYLLTLWLLCRRDMTPIKAFGAGFLWAMSTYVGFAMAPTAVIPGVAALLLPTWRERIVAIAMMGLAVALFYVTLIASSDYLLVWTFKVSTGRHMANYALEGMNYFQRVVYVVPQFFEFALAVGPALFVMFLFGLRRSVDRETLPMLALLVVTPFSGAVVSESARLWAHLMPFVAIIAARAPMDRRVVVVALACQIGVAVVLFSISYFAFL